VSAISPGHFPSRTFPYIPNHKPNPSSNPNTNRTSPNPTDTTVTLLTPFLTLYPNQTGYRGNFRG